jgi:hypothetical protein
MGKVEVGLALDGSISHTVVIKEFAERRKLKTVGSGVPVDKGAQEELHGDKAAQEELTEDEAVQEELPVDEAA